MTYQSLPYPLTVSIISSCGEVGAAGLQRAEVHQGVLELQNRGAGMPRSITGAGSDVCTTAVPLSASAGSVPTFTSPLRSKLYQSSTPPP